MKRMLARLGARVLEQLGITVEEVGLITIEPNLLAELAADQAHIHVVVVHAAPQCTQKDPGGNQ